MLRGRRSQPGGEKEDGDEELWMPPPASFFQFQLLVFSQETSWRCFHHAVQQELPREVLLGKNERHLKFYPSLHSHLLLIP